MFPAEQTLQYRAPSPDSATEVNGIYVITGNVFEGGAGRVSAFGTSPREPGAYPVGKPVDLKDGGQLTVAPNGDVTISVDTASTGTRGMRIFATTVTPPLLKTTARCWGPKAWGARFSTP